MKQLQNGYTTVEQSKRLLEIGVPAHSSDFHYTVFATVLWHHEPGDIDFSNSDAIPIWSVGRLIEIVVLTTFERDVYNLKIEGIRRSIERNRMLEDIIEDIETLIKDNRMDFSKLED